MDKSRSKATVLVMTCNIAIGLMSGCGVERTPMVIPKTVEHPRSFIASGYSIEEAYSPDGEVLQIVKGLPSGAQEIKLRVYLRYDQATETNCFTLTYPWDSSSGLSTKTYSGPTFRLPSMVLAKDLSHVEWANPPRVSPDGFRLYGCTYDGGMNGESNSVFVLNPRKAVKNGEPFGITQTICDWMVYEGKLGWYWPIPQQVWALVAGQNGRLFIYLDDDLDGVPEVVQYYDFDRCSESGLKPVSSWI
jgi:hypothetical protein